MKTRRLLGIVEFLCWVIGITLVTLYVGLRIEGEIERRQAIADFEAVVSPLTQGRRSEAPVQPTVAPPPLTYAVPDKSHWSKSRAQAYQVATTGQNGKRELPIAVLRIRSIGLEVPVYSALTENNLNRGAALVAGTARPGTDGNTAIAGHRDGYFRALRNISLGDVLSVRTVQGYRRYKVIWLKIVKPVDISVLRRTATPAITLVTCYPFHFVGSAPSRFVVRAVAIHHQGPP